MEGVTWQDRQPSDWLASNGRWYPARNYPNGWNSSALPPAPGHGGTNSLLEKYTRSAARAAGLADSGHSGGPTSSSPPTPTGEQSGPDYRPTGERTPRTPTSPSSPPPSSSSPGFSVARSGRSVADATVTSQKTYANTVGAAAPPPPAIGSPSPPGRVRSDAPKAPATVPTPPAPPAPTENKSEIEVIAGDLGAVFGSARKRIEKALNDSFEG